MILSVEFAFCGAGAVSVRAARVTGDFTRRKIQGVTREAAEAAADRVGFKSFFGGTGGGSGSDESSSERQGRTASTQSKEPALDVE